MSQEIATENRNNINTTSNAGEMEVSYRRCKDLPPSEKAVIAKPKVDHEIHSRYRERIDLNYAP
ncbi:MAG: hypothetical protein JSR61_06595 [Proteobacteria bacterium]|nr:hypothetical protein [Pseudomonadota bacterium]